MKKEKRIYCSKCGQENNADAQFCQNCSAPLQNEKDSEFSYSERKQEYAGKIIKCPACGEELPSFTAICPACGHEINSSRVSESLDKFIAQIEECDRRIANSPEIPKKGWSTWGKWKKIGWVLLNLYFACIPLLIYVLRPLLQTDKAPALTADEKYKATIIENFPFPNDRGSILEALLFIKSKVAFLAAEKINANNSYWMRLWTKKAEQLHEKAEILFPGDKIANETYQEILKNSNIVKKKLIIRLLLTVGVIIIFVAFMGVRSGKNGIGNLADNKDYDQKYDWQENQFTTLLPKPESEYGKVTMEMEKQFSVEIYKTSTEMYEEYVKECRNNGFTVDITKTEGMFSAHNEEGYQLYIYYYENKKEMHISIDSNDIEEKGFAEGTYESLKVKNFVFDIPDYWEEEGSKNEYLQYYAEKGEKLVMLSIAYPVETDDDYDVSFDGLYQDNENMIDMIASMFTDGDVIDNEVFESSYGVKGILYRFSCNQKINWLTSVDANGYCFCFPSEKDRRWFYVYYVQTNKVSDNDYKDDYMKLISSIREK